MAKQQLLSDLASCAQSARRSATWTDQLGAKHRGFVLWVKSSMTDGLTSSAVTRKPARTRRTPRDVQTTVHPRTQARMVQCRISPKRSTQRSQLTTVRRSFTIRYSEVSAQPSTKPTHLEMKYAALAPDVAKQLRNATRLKARAHDVTTYLKRSAMLPSKNPNCYAGPVIEIQTRRSTQISHAVESVRLVKQAPNVYPSSHKWQWRTGTGSAAKCHDPQVKVSWSSQMVRHTECPVTLLEASLTVRYTVHPTWLNSKGERRWNCENFNSKPTGLAASTRNQSTLMVSKDPYSHYAPLITHRKIRSISDFCARRPYWPCLKSSLPWQHRERRSVKKLCQTTTPTTACKQRGWSFTTTCQKPLARPAVLIPQRTW